MDRLTLAEEIEATADSDPVEAVLIATTSFSPLADAADPRRIPSDRLGVVLQWDEARPLLDYRYDNDYGSEDCHAVYAHTANWVVFIEVYDGATLVAKVPRHPQPGRPRMFGGTESRRFGRDGDTSQDS